MRKYVGSNNRNTLIEQFEPQGYAVGFEMHLPAAKITKDEMCTRVTLYPHKELNDMTKAEKIEACYQHACLVNEDGHSMNNQSVRERFNLKKTQSSVA